MDGNFMEVYKNLILGGKRNYVLYFFIGKLIFKYS